WYRTGNAELLLRGEYWSVRVGDEQLTANLAPGEGRRVDVHIRVAADDCLQRIGKRADADFRPRVERSAVVHAEIQREIARAAGGEHADPQKLSHRYLLEMRLRSAVGGQAGKPAQQEADHRRSTKDQRDNGWSARKDLTRAENAFVELDWPRGTHGPSCADY